MAHGTITFLRRRKFSWEDKTQTSLNQNQSITHIFEASQDFPKYAFDPLSLSMSSFAPELWAALGAAISIFLSSFGSCYASTHTGLFAMRNHAQLGISSL
jgi:hypothetical protein